MNHQLDWLDELGEHPRLEKEQIINTEYERQFKDSSVDTKSMESFFKTKYREILWLLKIEKK